MTDQELHNNLIGLPRVNWITLDRSWPRQEAMIRQFERLGITGHQRYRAFDGQVHDYFEDNNIVISDHARRVYSHPIPGNIPISIVIAVALSHIYMIKDWYETTDEPIGFFCEDDVDLELSRYWPWTWGHVIEQWPLDCDIMQLSLIRLNDAIPPWLISLQPRYSGNWGLAAYALTRQHARLIIEETFHTPGKCHLIIPHQPDVILNPETMVIRQNDRCRTWPIFAERLDNVSESRGLPKEQRLSAEIVHDYYKNPRGSISE